MRKRTFKRCLALALAVSMLGSDGVASASASIGSKVQEKKQLEERLKAEIYGSDELAAEFPKGRINFLATQYEVSEGDDYLQIGIMRQGGTEGEASVRFKAIDITSSYGDDYTIYTNKKKNSPIEKGEDAFPLIESAMTKSTNISTEAEEEATDGSDIVEDAASDFADTAKEEKTEGKNLEDCKDTDEVDTVGGISGDSKISTTELAKASSLKDVKEAYTGTESDRANWRNVSSQAEADEVRENYDLFFDYSAGSEVELTFEDGEYIKYLYLRPKDDKIAEAEEQLICVLLAAESENAVPVGDSFNAYVNIIDNEKFEESEYEFADTEITADGDTATVTLRRTAGENNFDTVYVGTGEGSANAGADYTAGIKQLEFYAGQTEMEISVDILENEYRVKDRDFYLLLSKDGEEYEDSGCHVVIPGNKKGTAKAMATTSNGAENISGKGFYTGIKGEWGVRGSEFGITRQGKGTATFSDKDTKVEFTGYGTVSALSPANILYGVRQTEFGFSSVGGGRSWKTSESYYKNGWNRFWGKKSWRDVDHHEDAYGVNCFVGNTLLYSQSGKTGWSVGTKNVDKRLWDQQVRFDYWANEGNATKVSMGWLRLRLQEYSYSISQASCGKIYTKKYNFKDKGSSLDAGTNIKEVTPTMKLSSVASNVGNNVKSANANTTVYRSDCLTFNVTYDSNCVTFEGIEASADGKTWIKVSSNNKVLMDAKFFKDLNLMKSSSSKIYFRPKATQKSASVKFTLADKTKGTYTNIDENYTAKNLHVGDVIGNIQGKSGSVASYTPTFYYKAPGANSYTKAENANLKLDDANIAGAVAIVTLKEGSQEVRLSYENPNVKVMADPNTYRNTYTNLTYTIDGKTYTKSADVMAAMETYYKEDKDTSVTISFDYMVNPKYQGTKNKPEETFGTPKYATLSVYSDEGELVDSYKLDANANTANGKTTYSFSKTGNWKELKWTEGTNATVTFCGSVVQYGKEKTTFSEEIPIDFLGTSGAYAMVLDESGNIMKDSNGNTVSSLDADLEFKSINPLTTYNYTGYAPFNFVTRWADYSLDTNNDGNIDSDTERKEAASRLEALGKSGSLVGGFSVYYGNTYPFQASTYKDTKLYYDFKKRDLSSGNNTVGLYLTKKSRTVLGKEVAETPLKNATVTFAGTELAETDGKGTYYSWGNYEKGANYLADIRYGSVHFSASVQGTMSQAATIDVSKLMMPTNFSIFRGGKDTKIKSTNAFLTIEDVTDEISFNFSSSVGVVPNKAKVIICDSDGKEILTKTVTRENATDLFTVELNPLKEGVKPGSTMQIQGIYSTKETVQQDGKDVTVDKDYVYPEVEVGMTYSADLTLFSVAASFNTTFNKTVKLFGKISTSFDLPLDVNLKDKTVQSDYVSDNGADIHVYQVAFGYNTEVMEKLKELQTEHRAENYGVGQSGRDTINDYIDALFEDGVEESDDKDDESEDDKKDDGKEADVNEGSENVKGAQDDTAKSSNAGNSSFEFKFSVALILTVETGEKNRGTETEPNYVSDGYNYFDSLALVAAAEANFQYSVIYTTPIGIDLIAEMAAGGKAVVAFGVESDNTNRYADAFNLSKNADEKGQFKLNAKDFSLYTKFLLAPTITVGAGVGVGSGAIKVTVSGTADFNFSFSEPIMGTNVSSAGKGTVTLSADLALKILFIKKKWNLYKSEEMDLFSYGAQSVGEMLNDFNENYLYEDVDAPENQEKITRDYLENRSKWQPFDASAMDVAAGEEITLQEGVYPYPQTDMVDLGDGKLLMVYIEDAGKKDANGQYVRDENNRAELMFTTSTDNGATWKERASVDTDNTWDENPCAFQVTEDKVLVTWSDANKVYAKDEKTADALTALDIKGAWFDVSNMTMGEEFAITETTEADAYADLTPMISYDEATQRLMVYFTKVDYTPAESDTTPKNDDDSIPDEDKTTYGDIINGYNVIAYRYADLKNGEFVWNTEYSQEEDPENTMEGYYGQRFLDLAVPVTIEETVEEKESEDNFYTVMDENGELSQKPVTETVITRTVTAAAVSDPRVIDSDLITYNGLSLYAYTMDFDSNLETTEDQQLYMQIYNYDTDEFHHPIQITADTEGNSMPQFVRCKNMTYLYWLGGGDIKSINITELVRSLETENSYLLKKEINGSSLYILDRAEYDPIQTAIAHESEVDEDGNVTENEISEFTVEANDNSMYVLWTAMTTSLKDPNASGVDNVIRETQVFGAYCEPKLELKNITEKFENTDEVEFTFAEGKDNTTYPVSAKALKDSEDGTVTAGDVYTYDYETKDEDLNGRVGVVKAGDPAVAQEIVECDGYDWSEPIQITREKGANYTDLSFRVTAENEIQASYAIGTQSLSEDGCFEEDLDSKTLCVRTFTVTSTIETGEITLDEEEELCMPGENVTYSLDITNDGLKPLENVKYRTYAATKGGVSAETEWTDLISTAATDEETAQDTTENSNVFLGGRTVTISNTVTLGDEIKGTKLVVEIKDAAGKVTNVEKTLEEKDDITVNVTSSELVDENTAEITTSVINSGNKDYKGDVTVKYGDTVLATQKDVEVACGDSTELTMTVDISKGKFGEVTTNEDGSKQDAMDLSVSCGDYSTDTQVIRQTSVDSGYALDAIKSVSIGASDATDAEAEPVKVEDQLDVASNEVMVLESMFDVDKDSAAAKKLAEGGKLPEAQMTTEWETSDSDVAYVNDEGLLIPMKEGEVEITAVIYPGAYAEYADAQTETGEGTEGDGNYVKKAEWYKLPQSLIQRKTIKVKVGPAKEEAPATEPPASEVPPTQTPAATATVQTEAPAEPVSKVAVQTAKATVNGVTYELSEDGMAKVTSVKKKATSVTIPAKVKVKGVSYKVTAIGPKAFTKCKTLKKVVIGKNVTSIGKQAFKGCSKLKTVIFMGKKPPVIGKQAFAGIAKKAVFKVPKASLTKYKKKLVKRVGVTKTMKIKKK